MAAALRFTKMQGIGNDYVYVNGFEEQVSDPGALARGISDRHFGVGSDGLVLILPSTVAGADARMRMFNADGSESEMCGNAVRCVGKYVHDAGICARDTVRIETLNTKGMGFLLETPTVAAPPPPPGAEARPRPTF